ncbi:MAG: DUF2975 domain-containing protein [Clostridia bacterium]|nr:DUF2975 domain-containing protein [Clostridia bacterium]
MNNKSLKAAIILTYIFMAILVVLVIALPMLVTWYVEIRGKSASLPTTMMVTCYPCAPFTGISLFCLKKPLKNAINDELFSLSSIRCLKYIAVSCAVITVITLIAGRYYLPFYIVGATFAFLGLLAFSFMAVLQNHEE